LDAVKRGDLHPQLEATKELAMIAKRRAILF